MFDLVIIGGGVAGLTAGIFAARRGVSCAVIEKNKNGAGARCGWRRDGYEIDGCLHWLTGTREGTELYGVWRSTGVLDGGCVRTPSFFSSTTDRGTVSFYDDAERTKEEMISLFPEDTGEILKFHRAVRAASSLSGSAGECAMRKSECLLTLAPYALLSAGELAERFRSEGMRRAVCDLTGGAYSSLGLIFAYAAYSSGNGYLPRGGSRGAAERMRVRYLSLGGELMTGCTAQKIARRGSRYEVTLDDGRVVVGGKVLCCIDPSVGVPKLFGTDAMPSGFARKLKQKEKYPVFSSVHFAFSAPDEAVPFRGTSYFSGKDSRGSAGAERVMLREFSHEPAFAPRGRSVLQTMAFTNETESRAWIGLRGDSKKYSEAKKEAARDAERKISEHYPSLAGKLSLIDSWTPATFSRYLGSRFGSYMSFALPPATLPAAFPRRVPGSGGVVFASQWSRSPGGLPNAALAGVRAVESIFG